MLGLGKGYRIACSVQTVFGVLIASVLAFTSCELTAQQIKSRQQNADAPRRAWQFETDSAHELPQAREFSALIHQDNCTATASQICENTVAGWNTAAHNAWTKVIFPAPVGILASSDIKLGKSRDPPNSVS